MPADPTLARLVADVDRATAALRAYVTGEPIEPEDDLVSLRDAEREFNRSADTCRRWARDEALGELIDGRWFLRRSLVERHKRV